MLVKELHPNVKIRISVNFFSGTANFMVVPFLAIYFSQKIGATITEILFVTVILSGIAGGVLGGFYGDRIGRKKIMLLGDFITVVAFSLIALVNSPWFDLPYVTYVIFLVAQFFSGIVMPVEQALLIDSSTSETRRLIFQIQYWVGNFSMALGSIMGAFLFLNHHFFLFLLVAFVVLVSLFITLFFIVDNYIPEKKAEALGEQDEAMQQEAFIKNYAFVIKDRVFLFFVLASLFTLTIEQQLTNYVGVRMADEISDQPLLSNLFGLHVNGVRLLGFLQSENTLLVVFGTFIVAWIVKKMNNQVAIISGVIIFTAGYIYLMFGTVPSLLILAMFVATIGELTYVPVKQAYLADIAPDDARSSYMAASSIISMFATIFAGFMITIGSLLTPGIMAGLIAILGIGGAAFFYYSGQHLKPKGTNVAERKSINVETI